MNWRDALCVAEFSDVHMFVYVNVVGETDDKLSTADMDNKNINSLLNGETKDESQIAGADPGAGKGRGTHRLSCR